MRKPERSVLQSRTSRSRFKRYDSESADALLRASAFFSTVWSSVFYAILKIHFQSTEQVEVQVHDRLARRRTAVVEDVVAF